jgi:DNA-binding IclR family transcriptional regulator
VVEERKMASEQGRDIARTPDDNATSTGITEKLVDALAALESAKSKELSERLNIPMLDVRNELLELEKLGIVYRTGQTRGTRWWLG